MRQLHASTEYCVHIYMLITYAFMFIHASSMGWVYVFRIYIYKYTILMIRV